MHTAYIGMGGNLPSWAGQPEATLTAAALRLERLGRVAGRSSLYSTEPVGFAAQPRFVNAVVALETELSPRELLHALMAIEQEFDRDRSAGIANGPRTLDLDILLYDNLEINEPGLEVPHPRLWERGFVLVPLREVAPALLDVRDAKTVTQSPHALSKRGESGSDEVVRIPWDSWRAGSLSAGDAGA